MYDVADHRKIADFCQKRFGQTYEGKLLAGMKEHHEAEVEPTDEMLPILNTRFDQRGEPIYLDLSAQSIGGGQPIIIFAPQGSGKSVFLAGLVKQLLWGGYCGINLSDIKNDTYYMQGQLQPQFRKFLPFWRKEPYIEKTAYSIDARCYIPQFLARKYKPYGIQPFQLNISDFSVDDLIKSFFKLDPVDPQALILRTVYTNVFAKTPPASVKELMEAIANINPLLQQLNVPFSKFSNGSVQTLNTKIYNLFGEEAIGDQYPADVVGDMVAGKYVSLCLNNSTGETDKSIIQGYMSSLIWKIFREKTNGRLRTKKVFMVIEDASEIALPPRKNPSSKEAIFHMMRVGRDKWIFPIIVTQSLSELGLSIINKAKYIIFFRGISGSDLEVLSKERLTRYGDILDVFDRGGGPERLMHGEYEGARSVVIWSNEGKIQKGWVPMPSCSIPLPKLGS